MKRLLLVLPLIVVISGACTAPETEDNEIPLTETKSIMELIVTADVMEATREAAATPTLDLRDLVLQEMREAMPTISPREVIAHERALAKKFAIVAAALPSSSLEGEEEMELAIGRLAMLAPEYTLGTDITVEGILKGAEIKGVTPEEIQEARAYIESDECSELLGELAKEINNPGESVDILAYLAGLSEDYESPCQK